MDRISRFGAYGILLKDSKILLTLKQSGPYQGLWDLPGGAIEYAETPEKTLQRELLEESALEIGQFQFLYIFTASGEYKKQDELYGFHQVGLIYTVLNWEKRAELTPQEENQWFFLNEIVFEKLTPFAKYAISHLKKWRPQQTIREKVIGLAKHENRLLVCEVLNDDGILKGWIPLGGGIEFGETAKQALKREILEELGSTIQFINPPIVMENIFKHHELTGHEIIFAFPITFDLKEIYSRKRFQFSEHGGRLHWAEWVPIERFEKKETVLFPSDLLKEILNNTKPGKSLFI